jgi:hypothetical protein
VSAVTGITGEDHRISASLPQFAKRVMKKRGRCGGQSVYTNLFLCDNNWPAIRAAMIEGGTTAR